ncbi:MAG: response regulator [Ignavibacteriales bacterium]|nr:response regulator [Ignavibacteriales bacterium]
MVEDYKHSQIIVTRLLKKNDFESIVVVENGQEALDAKLSSSITILILMDMQMPVMNGFEATRKIRELNEYKDTLQLLHLTAFAMKGDREKCLEAGATDYIPKPIDSHEFIQKVKYYTENKVGCKSRNYYLHLSYSAFYLFTSLFLDTQIICLIHKMM